MFLTHIAPEQVEPVARAVTDACRGDAGGGDAWPDPLQPRLLHTLFNRLLGCDLDFETLEPLPAAEVEPLLAKQEERHELIQLMAVVESLCNPVPEAMQERIAAWADALMVKDDGLVYLRELVSGEQAKAVADFYRLNWIGELGRRREGFEERLRELGAGAYARTVKADAAEAARWHALARCPEGSLGRALATFYEQRGFTVPGEVGAVSAAVAQHDWIHVVADYGTTPLGEIEVAGLQCAASRTPATMLGLLGVLALFESSLMPKSMIVDVQPGRALEAPGGLDRFADAIVRGGRIRVDPVFDVDYFAHADEPLEAVRERFGVPPKSAAMEALDPYGARRLPPPEMP